MAGTTKMKTDLSPKTLKQMYHEMLMIRHFEEKCNQVYRMGKAGGYLHVYSGMEATAVGWLHAIKQQYDNVITAYRDHAHALLLGCDPVAVMAEIMGRSDGLSRGKGGSMHLYDIEKRLYGGWGIVGGHIPVGTGLAYASAYKGEDRVTLNFFGDGASNAGVLFESLNMAGLWDLPCIYIIENNEFSMGTRLEYHAADTELYKRGYPFNMKHERVDGMDVLQVFDDAKRIVDYVRQEQKPYLVEIMNYRFEGHGAADNDQGLYRTKEELEKAKKRDPITHFEKYLKKEKIMTQKEMESLSEKILEEVEEIYEKADQSPMPGIEEVYDNVYTDLDPERGH